MKALMLSITATLILLSATNTLAAAAPSFDVKHRAIERSLYSQAIHAEIVVKNTSGRAIPLNELVIDYAYTREGSADSAGKIIRALILGSRNRNIKSYTRINDHQDKLRLSFSGTTERLEANAVAIVQFHAQKRDGSAHRQSNDRSFNAFADFLTPNGRIDITQIPQITIKGRAVDEQGQVVPNAIVTVNSTKALTNASGEYDINIPEEDLINIEIQKNGFADYFNQYSKEEFLGGNATRRVARLRRWRAQQSIDPRFGGRLSTSDGVEIIFPPSTNKTGAFNVGLTSIYSRDNGALSDLGVYKGLGLTLGETALQFFHAIDTVIVDMQTGRRVTLENYDPPITIKIKTSCANERLAPMDTWYLDEASGIWREHNQNATFIKADRYGRCFFQFTVDHFTKYALARPYSSDFTNITLDIPFAGNEDYILELENRYGIVHSARLSRSQLDGYQIGFVPTSNDLYVTLKSVNGLRGSSVRLSNMPNFNNRTRVVRLNSPGPLLWQTQWLDRDNPSGSGDHELLEVSNFGCDAPIAVKARRVGSGTEYLRRSDIPEVIENFDRVRGLACINNQQSDSSCEDYEINTLCPTSNAIFR